MGRGELNQNDRGIKEQMHPEGTIVHQVSVPLKSSHTAHPGKPYN